MPIIHVRESSSMGRPKINLGECAVVGCGKSQHCKQMCQAHYTQTIRKKPIKEVKLPTEHCDNWKVCGSCKFWVVLEEFSPKSDRTALSSVCKRCATLRRHNITAREYDEMLFKQKGRCAACGDFPREGTRLAVDHDHACCPSSRDTCGNCIRGLLCERCNWTLGKVNDSVENLLKLIEYVERNCRR